MKILAFALDFSGGHIIDRAPNVFFVGVVRFGGANQAEIDQFRLALGIVKYIARLDVAVQEIVLQGRGEGGGGLDADVQHVQLRDRAIVLDARVQAALVGQFHDEVRLPFKLIEAVNMNDICVVQ